ncbi:hypothetical protein V5O48_003837 [Marasmius crinis-equi]|uniref:Uncharacterized protein n=1 Tax=Marasmius crinis-equi TaxID=585013 RepID=A0ABR3FRS9_9AGAR
MLGKRKSLPALKVFLHHKAEVVSNPNNTSPRSSGESDSSVESLEEEGGRARKVKSMQVSNTPSPYYDEFTASADLSALSISSEDATLLDVDDPFGSDPFASTPPASPRTAYHPVGANFLDEDPYASPLASPTTLQSFPSEIPSASPVPPVPSTLRPPSAVKHHSPLSPIKDTFPTVASETKPQPRRHELPKPQQPSLEMLSVVVMQAPTRSVSIAAVPSNAY